MSQTSFTVPQSVRNNAKRGLELRRKHRRGGITNQEASKQGIGSGVQRASDLMSGSVSEKTVRRMHAFFSRHSAFKKFHKDKTSAAYISWMIWGGDAGKRWADSVFRKLEAQKSLGFADLVKAWRDGELNLLKSWDEEGEGMEWNVNAEVCDCAECCAVMDRWDDVDDADDVEENFAKGERRVPEKYLEGLKGEERAKRKKQIQERMESGKAGGYKELQGDDKAKTKPSKYSGTGIASKIRKELKGKTGKGEFLTVASRVSGVSRSILERCYDRGMAAWATGGHRPGASQTAWAVARVYSLLSGGKTRSTADKDLWAEHTKMKKSWDEGDDDMGWGGDCDEVCDCAECMAAWDEMLEDDDDFSVDTQDPEDGEGN